MKGVFYENSCKVILLIAILKSKYQRRFFNWLIIPHLINCTVPFLTTFFPVKSVPLTIHT